MPSKIEGDLVHSDTDGLLQNLNVLKVFNFKNLVFQTLQTEWHQNSDYLYLWSIFICNKDEKWWQTEWATEWAEWAIKTEWCTENLHLNF